jgi:hypothetical protein
MAGGVRGRRDHPGLAHPPPPAPWPFNVCSRAATHTGAAGGSTPQHRCPWTCHGEESGDHQARLPANDSLDEQLARGPEAAADAFESVGRLRLEPVLDNILARDLGKVPAIVEGPQLMPGFADQLPPGWAVWLVPDPARAHLVQEDRLAKEEALAGRPAAGRSRLLRILQRDTRIAERVRASAALSGRPVTKVPPSPDWPAIAAAVESALAAALQCAPRLTPGAARASHPQAPAPEPLSAQAAGTNQDKTGRRPCSPGPEQRPASHHPRGPPRDPGPGPPVPPPPPGIPPPPRDTAAAPGIPPPPDTARPASAPAQHGRQAPLPLNRTPPSPGQRPAVTRPAARGHRGQRRPRRETADRASAAG